MVGGKLDVDLDALACSAAHVGGQAEDLASAHLSSDDQITAAQPGWVSSSAAALARPTCGWRPPAGFWAGSVVMRQR